MKFAYGLPVIIFGVANIMMLHQVAVASESEVNAIAQKITVRISGSESGTGVIVDKQGNIYTVLTNWHVVDTTETYTIQTKNGGSYQVKSSQVKRLPGVDLAFFQFQSNQTYETANIANSDQVTVGTKVYAAGWADGSGLCGKQRCFLNPSGNLDIRLENADAKNGYTWIYTNNIKPGMSGGPVLDEQGRLVGINGRGIKDARTGAIDFLAIPINTYVNLAPISPGIKFNLAKTLTGQTGRVTSVAFSPDGRTLASGNNAGNENGRIQIWDVATGKLLTTLTGHSSWVNSVTFSPDGRTLASAGNNGQNGNDIIKIWDAATGQLLKTITDLSPAKSIAFSPDGRTLAVGMSTNTKNIKIWDVATGQLLKTLTSNTQEVYSVAFSHDGKTLASGSYDRTLENSGETMDNSIKIWDVATGEQLKNLTGHGYVVTSVVFSPDGKTLASGSGDYTIKIWDTATGKLLKTFKGHKDVVSSVAFSPDGRTLVSGSWSREGMIRGSINIWDVTTGKLLKTLDGHDIDVSSVAFSPDGKTLASGSIDESIKIWQMSGR